MRWLILKNQLGLQALSPQSISPPTQFSEDIQQTYRALLASSPGYYMTFPEELEGLERSLPQIRDMRLNTLGEMPFVVLVAGEDQEPNPSIGLTTQVVQQQAQAWFEMQIELAALSSSSQLMIAQNSNHMIPLQQPEMVVQAIEIVIDRGYLSSKPFKGFE